MPTQTNTKKYSKMTDAELDRFNKYLDLPQDIVKDCWNWKGYKTNNGYGKFKLRKRSVLAHRLALVQSTGINPVDLEACHNCNNRKCINPSHLRWDTHKNNQHDRVANGTDSKGIRNGRVKLTEQQVLDIRSDNRHNNIIAKQYGVSSMQIYYIKSGKLWKHLN
jgi:hypothetical protein